MAIRRIHDGFLPGRHPIDAYGSGGFRFGGMSHQGSILALPSGIHAWEANSPAEIDEAGLRLVFDEASQIDFLLIGMGELPFPISDGLRALLKEQRVTVDAMTTAAAARTYNILLGERRQVAAALIVVA